MKILFVCTGNTCRSPMAEHLMKKMLADKGRTDVEVGSAGTSPATWLALPEEARRALLDEGVKGVVHKPHGLGKELVSQSDLIFTMENHHREFVVGQYPEAGAKVHQMGVYAGLPDSYNGIADPFGQSVGVYAATLAEIKKNLLKIIEKI